MILADDIAASRGTINDFGLMSSSVYATIEKSERFVLSDEVAIAAYKLIKSRPSSMLAARPLCRLPYKSMWVEWRGGISSAAGWELYPAIERHNQEKINRVEPIRMGCLIEALDETRQRGQMTWGWLHPIHGINYSPLSVNFDWTEGGNVETAAAAAGLRADDSFTGMLYRRWISKAEDVPEEVIINTMIDHTGWNALAGNKIEISALRELLKHEAVWISRHGTRIIDMLSKESPEYIAKAIQAWEGDITGEAPFMSAFIMMLNSRNAIEHTHNDISRLNRARHKRGDAPFLDHHITKLYMSKARRRAVMAGTLRGEARGTDVMGHFKIRKSGVWWWNEHWRGDRTNPMPRSHYETVDNAT